MQSWRFLCSPFGPLLLRGGFLLLRQIRTCTNYGVLSHQASKEPTGDLLVSGSRVAAEIRIQLADGTSMHVVDLFHVEDELIRTLTYFVADH